MVWLWLWHKNNPRTAGRIPWTCLECDSGEDADDTIEVFRPVIKAYAFATECPAYNKQGLIYNGEEMFFPDAQEKFRKVNV